MPNTTAWKYLWHEIPLIRKGRWNRIFQNHDNREDLFLEIINKRLFLDKGKHIFCCRHFLEHGESAKGGWGVGGDSGVCCFKECTMPQIILWNLLFCTNGNFGICVLEQKQSHLPTPHLLPSCFCDFSLFPSVFHYNQVSNVHLKVQLSLFRMVVLYQLNCQRMVAQWMGEGENTKGQYSDYTEDVRWASESWADSKPGESKPQFNSNKGADWYQAAKQERDLQGTCLGIWPHQTNKWYRHKMVATLRQ